MATLAERLAQEGGNSDRGQGPNRLSLAERLTQTPGDVGASLFGQLDFDKTVGLPFSTRLKVNAADTVDEKSEAFFGDIPEGDLQRVPVSGEYVFRFNGQDETEPYKTIERDITPSDDPMGAVAELATDVSEFVTGTAGPMTAEIAAAIATRGRSLLARLGAQALGGFIGEFAQEGAEMAAIPGQGEPLGSTAARGGVSAVMAPAGFGAGEAATNLVSGAAGRGMMQRRPGADDAMAAIDALNKRLEEMGADIRIPQLSSGQGAEMPLLARVEEQSAALTTPVRRHRQAQTEGVQRILNESVDEQAISQARGRLDRAYALEENRLIATMRNPRVPLSGGGKALDEGIEVFDKSSQVAVNNLYDLARAIDEPSFDIDSSGLLGAADDLLKGTPRRARNGGIVQTSPPDPSVAKIANEIKNIDPNAVDVDALRAWRQRLWDLKTPEAGGLPTQANFQAGRLYRSIGEVLDKPLNRNPRFLAAWKNANARAGNRFETLEKAVVTRIVRSGNMASNETIEQLANALQQPYQATNLKFLKSILPNESYAKFVDSFKTKLLSDPGGISRVLDNFDDETIQFLLTPSDRAAFRTLSESVNKLNSAGIQEALQAQTVPRAALKDLLSRGDTSGIAALMGVVRTSGGVNSDVGKSLRYALMDLAFDKFIVSGETVSRKAIQSFLKDLNDKGLGGLMTSSDRQLILELSRVAPFFGGAKPGTGANIAAAEISSGVIEGSPSAIMEFIEKAGAGRILVNPAVRRFLIGSKGNARIDTDALKVIGAAAATAFGNTEQTQEAVQAINGVL